MRCSPQKESKQTISDFWKDISHLRTDLAWKQNQEGTHKTLFMVCLIMQLYLLSHIIKPAVREGMVLMAGFTKRSTERVYGDDGHCFYFFLIPAVIGINCWQMYYNSELNCEVDGLQIACCFFKFNSNDLWQQSPLVSTANALIWGLLTLFCFVTAS